MSLKELVDKHLKPGKGRLIFVGARPAVGKTAFVLSCADILSAGDCSVLYFDLENAAAERMKGRGQRNVTIISEECIDVSSIREKCKEIQDESNLIVIIDYLQLIDRQDGSIIDVQSKLRNITDELGITIVVTSQLPVAIDQRDDNRPNANDMELIGLDKNLYDKLLFLYRPAYYDSNADRRQIFVLADGVENEMIWDEDGLSVE